MYKLLLVDDEEDVRQGMVEKINWGNYNFVVIGEAKNGRDAIDIIENNTPDVVITDIYMPLMNGLELASFIHQNYSTIKTVILTGFEDFEFAKKAIKYDVLEYLSKPIHPKELSDLLFKLKNTLDEEFKEKEDINKLRQYYTDSLPLLKDSFLLSLILKKQTIDEINKKTSLFNLSFDGHFFATSVVVIDEIQTKRPLDDDMDMELMKLAVQKITIEILNKHNLGETFFYDNKLIIISTLTSKNKLIARNKLITVLEKIRQYIEKHLLISITIGLGSLQDSLVSMNASYLSSLTALGYKLVLGGNKVIFVGDLEPEIASILLLDEEKEEKLITSLKFGSDKDVVNSVAFLFDMLRTNTFSVNEYKIYFMEILSLLLKQAKIFQIDIKTIVPNTSNFLIDVTKFTSLEQAKTWFLSFCIALHKQISNKRLNSAQILFEKAKDYLNKNYADADLTVQKIADYLYISPSYLSYIFKKETKETFLKFLMHIRLEKAKTFLKDSSLTITAVAEKVGYPDISYFSYFFKKNEGKSPREFRRDHINKED